MPLRQGPRLLRGKWQLSLIFWDFRPGKFFSTTKPGSTQESRGNTDTGSVPAKWAIKFARSAIFFPVSATEIHEQKGKFFDAADLYEKAAKEADKTDDKELQNELLSKIEECMVKGEEKREKLDKMFSI